ncbi:hypothetical protein GCM10017044_00020 [Kordiimonas sediminis]|uniref:Uncharacterized protein n=1 Tax=Kordiimonas sediminis TaxID=1735581 RepID=A0A919AIT0_9PROT|nr:hypothetical protein [Kordiimonas sediminis]GHF10337.1 hypothetical protein GCM10017044_00020 [Kordiimonas sediminis]
MQILSRCTIINMTACLATVFAVSATGNTQDNAAPNLKAFEMCVSVESDLERLACFDAAAKTFDFKKTQKVLDNSAHIQKEAERLRAEAKAARDAEQRLKAEAEAKAKALEAQKKEEFGRADAEVRTVDLIEDEILRIHKPKVGGIVLMLKNSQVWQQVDGNRPGRIVPGMKVKIKKTRMGGYLMTIELSGKVIRVKRII